MPRPRVLVVSLSPIHRDSRVLRQISVVAQHAEVTTVGYGTHPQGADHHVQVPDSALSLPQTVGGVALLATRRHTQAAAAIPAARVAIERVAGQRFDAVVANDARSLALAHELADGAPVWADMHEWAPEERTHVLSWRLLVAPLMDDLCRRYLPRCAAVTTVGPAIAELYEQRYGVKPRVMRSAPSFVDLQPSPVADDRIRLVHSGGAVPGRSLETMIDAVRDLGARFPLDLYLVPAGDGGAYLKSLRDRAAACSHITFHDPVKPEILPATLNAYDVGVFWIPPFNTNAKLTLPNKLFDFIQARLAVAIGPSVEMAPVVREYGLGPIADGFSTAEIVRSLEQLSVDDVREYKSHSSRAAKDLNFEHEAEVAHTILRELLDT